METEKIKVVSMSSRLRLLAVFIAVLFTSMLGAQFCDVSLNKIALIPLLLILVYDNLNTKTGSSYGYNYYTLIYSLFFLSAAISSIFALSANYADKYEGYTSDTILFFVQIFIFYIPLLLLLTRAHNKKVYFKYFKKSLICVARLNVLWAAVQFVAFYLFGEDINVHTISFFYGGVTAYRSPILNLDGIKTSLLRLTGLSYEPAYYGLIIVIGFCFDRNGWVKLLYFIGAVLAVSRASIFAIVFIAVGKAIINLINNRGVITFKFRMRKLLMGLILIIAALIFVTSYFDLSLLHKILLSRLNIGLGDDIGTGRHLLYPSAAIKILCSKYNFFQILFGYGPRNSGTILVNFAPEYNSSYMTSIYLTEKWATECDFSELLLGYGIIGFGLYVALMLSCFKIINKDSIIYLTFLLIGFMYDISSSTYLVLFMIFTCAGFNRCINQTNKIQNRKKCNF